MSFEEFWTFLPRLIGFFLTYPLRVFFGIDFDWGIRYTPDRGLASADGANGVIGRARR
jgi:hypothetical protein